MSPASTSIPLPAALRTLHTDLVLIAEAWLDTGAAEVAVVHGQQRTSLAGSTTPGTPALRAPLPVPKIDAELEVVGADAGQLAHLFSDAELVGRLARRDQEVRELTDALIAANDQLVAMHDLATTTATGDDIDELCNSIADDALRLTGAAAVAIAGLAREPVSLGSHALREELVSLARPRVDGVETLRPDETTFGRPVIIGSVPGTDAGVAIAGHEGQEFGGPTGDLVGALALRAHAHCRQIAHRGLERERAHCSAMENVAERLTDVIASPLPQPSGATVAVLSGHDDGGTPDFAVGAPTRTGGIFAYGTTERTGPEATLRSLQRTNHAYSTFATTLPNADDTAARPAPNVATILEDLLRAGRTVDEPAEPTAATAVVEWHQQSGTASIAATGGVSVLARQAGRTRLLDATHTVFGTALDGLEPTHTIRLSPGDALLLVSDGLVSDPGGHREPLGLSAIKGCLATTTHHPAQDMLDQLLVLAQRHAGGRRISPCSSALALVVDGTA